MDFCPCTLSKNRHSQLTAAIFLTQCYSLWWRCLNLTLVSRTLVFATEVVSEFNVDNANHLAEFPHLSAVC